MSKKLTVKQEKFVLKYFECGNASEAYRYAYSASKMKDSTVWEKSSLMLKNDKVRARLQELRTKAEEESKWSVEKIIKAHTRIFEIGIGDVASSHIVSEGAEDGITKTIEVEMRDTNLASAKGALVEIGKILGYYEKDNKQKSGDISLEEFAEYFYNKNKQKSNADEN